MTASLISTTRNVYDHLEDELSKRIFENRLLFSLTGNYCHIYNIVHADSKISFLNDARVKLKSVLGNYDDVIVYGAGYLGRAFTYLCEDIRIAAFCDSDAEKRGRYCSGHKIISPEELRGKHEHRFVIITVLAEKAILEIENTLLSFGFDKNRILVLRSILSSSQINLAPHRDASYFDPEIILPRISREEVFIDAGCCNFYTGIQFVKRCNNQYDKVIAFEPNPKQYPICVERSKGIRDVTIHPYALWSEDAELYFDSSGIPGAAHVTDESYKNTAKIKGVKLDDVLKGENATFIKMDIEGAELNALKGAEQTILKLCPKLAISVYHKPEDIWEIPEYVLSLQSSYKLYLRHYSLIESETVLYAV